MPDLDADMHPIVKQAQWVIRQELTAIEAMIPRLGKHFVASVEYLQRCRGRIVVVGMGKSGLIGQKISATFASIGAPSYFVHAAEAAHGDLGRFGADDVVLLLSNSGSSPEITKLLSPLQKLAVVCIAITGNANSVLAKQATCCINIGQISEACPMDLVPTASTTAMLVIGDALAMCLLKHRGTNKHLYASLHPGGALGQQLLSVAEVMRTGISNPIVAANASLRETLVLISQTPGRPGAASIVDTQGKLIGFFTDGDLRRLLQAQRFDVDTPIHHVMHHKPRYITAHDWLSDAVALLNNHQIDQLPVVNDAHQPIGLLDIQDVLFCAGR